MELKFCNNLIMEDGYLLEEKVFRDLIRDLFLGFCGIKVLQQFDDGRWFSP